MDDVLAMTAAVAVLALVYRVSSHGAAATQSVFAGYFKGFQPDPWPHGVQEEDIVRPWGSAASETESTPTGAPWVAGRSGGPDESASEPVIEDLGRASLAAVLNAEGALPRTGGAVPTSRVRDTRIQSPH